MRISTEYIDILDESGNVVAGFGVNHGTRGRELAERDLIYNENRIAVYRGNVLRWVLGPHYDVILDHPSLPSCSRSKYLWKNEEDNTKNILGCRYDAVKVILEYKGKYNERTS